ncbi:hypothetical protein [Virgibacillus sediminis]|uniref:Uncharacterized protein n=1 Tax=Virgibacillus sediminis TaxID=202260 RepID=A0ABV7AB42_9BACI
MEQHRFFDTYAFFTKGQESFSQVVNRLMDSRVITECKSLKVFPQTFGINYLLAFQASEEQVVRELAYRRILHVPANETGNTIRGHPEGLSQIVQHEGEEMYFVNLLDTDLVKIKHILQYRKDRYELNGRKVLVLTHPGLRPEHERLLQHVHHVHFLEVGGEILDTALRNQK